MSWPPRTKIDVNKQPLKKPKDAPKIRSTLADNDNLKILDKTPARIIPIIIMHIKVIIMPTHN